MPSIGIAQRRNNLDENMYMDYDYNSIRQGDIMQHGHNNRNAQLSIIQNEGLYNENPMHFHIPHNDISQEHIFQEGSGNSNTQLTVIQNELRRLNRIIEENRSDIPSNIPLCT